jgi:hypothetical protein
MSDSNIDAWANELLALVESSSEVQDLAVGQDRARVIGREINDVGGFQLMREVAYRTRDLGLQKGQRFALGYVERWWDGIGRWKS